MTREQLAKRIALVSLAVLAWLQIDAERNRRRRERRTS